MSSPFRHFRKHSKAFMAVAAVMCMFLFVFASGTGGGRSSDGARDAGATVATWNGGSINQRELASYVRNRLLTNELLQRLFIQGGGQQPEYDLPRGLTELMLRSQQPDYVEMDAIAIEVVSNLATKAGMTVSDDMINRVLEIFAQKNISAEDMQGIFASLGGGDARTNETVVFNTLRKMLLAYFYRQGYQDASFVVLPQERWEDWRRVNERIALTVAVLPVEGFEADVPAPTEPQLRDLYEEFKNVVPNEWKNVDGRDMPSATPGFAQPRRVRFQFLQANVADRTDKHLDEVTEEEIADYYDRNKRSEFVKMSFGSDERTDETPDDSPSSESPDEPAVNQSPADPSPENGAEPAEQATPAPGDAPADAPAPQSPAQDDPPQADEPEKPANEQGAARRRSSPFRLAAFQTAPESSDETAPADEASAPQDAPAADAPAQSVAEESAPSDDAPGTDAPATDAPANDASTSTDVEETADNDSADDDIVEYEPLEKVRDEIRRTLARDKAVAELEKVMSEAAAELQSEYNAYGARVIAAKEAKRKPPKTPAKLSNLQWLADKYGLAIDKTALLTDRELFDTAVGKAADVSRGTTSVTGAAFTTLEPFEPFLAKELEGDWYLTLKVEDEQPRVPDFTEVRDQVVAQWKRREAAKLAEKAAKDLAAEAMKSGQSFDEFFKSRGYEVIPQTELFSWKTLPVDPMSGYPPVISEVPGLKNVGPEFMEAAFTLGDGEATGVLNFNHSDAYAIKLHSRQYTERALKDLFLEEDRFWPGQIGTRRLRQQMFAAAVDQEILKDRANLEFDEEWRKMREERAQR